MKRLLTALFFTLVPALAHSATYYVATSGSNLNTCTQAQSVGTAKLSIAAGLACLAGGDTLTIKAGTYTESVAYHAIPAGTASARTMVQGAPGETITIKPNSGNAQEDVFTIYDRDYITLDNLIID